MTNYIVLVKQVPDITQITDNAFNPETGTLIRSRLDSVINDLDSQALAFAKQMKQSSKSDGEIVCLSMGPPMAQEVLKYCLCRDADTAILLTDRALGGADTYATANPLAFAIRKIVKDIFNNNQDYFIISGMQSVDGDTAQVPAQIAEELKLPCIAYATDVQYHNSTFQFERIISGGSQTVTPKTTPAVITVAKHPYPSFATFQATRKAASTKILTWQAEQIKASAIGVQGSKTRVIRVFPPGKTNRKCKKITDAGQLAKIISEQFNNGQSSDAGRLEKQTSYTLPANRQNPFDRSFEATEKENIDYSLLSDILQKNSVESIKDIDEDIKALILKSASKSFHKKALDDMLVGLETAKPTYTGQVWVVAEHKNDNLHPAAFELLGKARELADSLNTKVGLCIAGYNIDHHAKELIAAGADDIYIIDDKLLADFDPTSYQKAIADAIGTYWPQIVLFAATPQGRMLAPMISYRLGCGLTADCTELQIRDSSRKQQIAILAQTRPALGGNVMATISTKDSRSQMATARPGVMQRLEPDYSRVGNIIKHKVQIAENDISLNVIKTELAKGSVNFDADIIVSGGKGMQNRDIYEKLVGSLCCSLEDNLKAKVEKGATRAAVEHGFAQRIHQVGQTGTAVGPKIYIALGISGAIQHMIGVANTQTIIAVNSDPNAPIFKQCDYYINETVENIVPELAQALNN